MSADQNVANLSSMQTIKPTGASSIRFTANIVGEAAQGNAERVKQLLRSTPNGTELKVDGVTALHVASRNGHFPTVRVLLAAGANVNCVDDRGQTALHHAAEGDQAAIMDLLLKSGALVDAMNFSKETALHVAVKHNWLDCVDMLLEHGCDVNLRHEEGETALHYALAYAVQREGISLPSSANDAITEMLVTAPNVDLSVKGFKGQSYLHYAARFGHEFGVELLTTTAEELLSQRDAFGWSPLHTAVIFPHYGICKTLIMCAPILVNQANHFGSTPLTFAAARRECSLVELMVLVGGNCNMRNAQGSTPLHKAFALDLWGQRKAELKNSPAINEILTQLSDIGETCMGLAIGCYLIRDGYADVDIYDENCNTPLDILEARESGNRDKLKKFVLQLVEVREEKVKPGEDKSHKTMSEQLDELKLKVTSLEDERRCQICMDRLKNVVFLCGHGACQTCAQVLSVCHMCRATIIMKIKCH